MTKPSSSFLLITLSAAALFAQPAKYRIAGMVVNAESGSALNRARVVLTRYGSTQALATQITGDDGRFSFEVPEGKFGLEAGTRVARQNYGISTPDALAGSSIITGPGQDTGNLVFRWFPRGAISGKVVDSTGDPVESALVQLLQSTVSGGRRMAQSRGWRYSDDRGEYRFGLLAGGSYLLAVTGTPWYSTRRAFTETSEPALAFVPTYFPNTNDLSRAGILILKPGMDARADFTLPVGPGANVVVKHDAPKDMKGRISLITEGVGGREGFQRQSSFSGIQQPFQLGAIPPGRYLLRLAGSEGTSDYSARKIIDVSGSEVNVELEVRKVPTVSGTVVLKNPKAKPKGTLLASLIREDNFAVLSTAVHADGTFAFPSVGPGRQRLAIRGTDGYFASDVHVEGTQFEDGIADLQEGEAATVRMVASDEIGVVQGFVMQEEKPIVGAMVVLAPAGGSTDIFRYRGFQTDSDGSFDFQNVPAGDYMLFATAETSVEYANPDVVRLYLAGAKGIHLEPHGTHSEKIPLSEPSAANKP